MNARILTFQDSRPIMEAARAAIAKDKGEAALEPWSLSYSIAGDTERAVDPYHPFEDAVDVWARTFAALGIRHAATNLMSTCATREKCFTPHLLKAYLLKCACLTQSSAQRTP
jgi:hypothetical protein